jgi:MOSC domain-containing protein YiiM
LSNQNYKLINIFSGTQKGQSKTAIPTAELIPNHGLIGDHHAGLKPHRQVSLFSAEILRQITEAGIEISPEELSTNLLTEGLELDALATGIRLKIGNTILEISEARKPCGALTKIDKRLPKATYLRCGQFARVIEGGVISAGDTIEIL